MTEEQYKDRLAVRSQLSIRDQFELLEYEFNLLLKTVPPDELKKMGIIRPIEGGLQS